MSLFSIDHHHYFHGDEGTSQALVLIINKLDFLTLKAEEIMATKQEQYDSIMNRLDAITNDIAADYKKLLDEIANGTVSQESLDRGSANVARLEEIGASVDNPVPEPPTEG